MIGGPAGNSPLVACLLRPITAQELAHLGSAADVMRQQNRPDAADALVGISQKLRASLGDRDLTRVDTDLESLIAAEGLAARPGPREVIDQETVGKLRRGILESRRVRIWYRGAESGKTVWHRVCPYGFLYGTRPHLLALSLNPNVLDYRNYRIANDTEIQTLDKSFERERHFSLKEYTERSFAMFQEEPVDVAWRFSAAVADEERNWVFHPSQAFEDQPDGTLIVRFRAGGRREMAWHLHTWGGEVGVLSELITGLGSPD